MKAKTRKKLTRAIIALLALLVLAFMVESSVIKTAVRKAIQQRFGFDLEIGSIRHGLLRPTFEVRDVRLINPEDFPEDLALEIRRIKMNVELRTLFTDTIHLRELVLDIPKIVVVRREDGKTNLQRLNEAARAEPPAPAAPAPTPPPAPGGETPAAVSNAPAPPAAKPWWEKDFRIDHLELKMGSVEVHDYVQGDGKPRVGVYELGVDQVLKDVTDPATIGVVIAATVAEKVGLQMVGDLDGLLKQHKDDLDGAGQQIDKAFKGLEKSFKTLFGNPRPAGTNKPSK